MTMQHTMFHDEIRWNLYITPSRAVDCVYQHKLRDSVRISIGSVSGILALSRRPCTDAYGHVTAPYTGRAKK